ncbi:hypothetical protein GPJ56_002013 [Histomonas meleagridis]|uniref:uncharacterized protein n=1 Tax=Histomonas meleagridis TaxID=135588 RepID=UPI00355A14C2|nr:hypothetical protein GPJ56_002013 [Histomonas meleagridis]KAH0800910.1 hypothetical protein GO595_006226 [Histomonas meleagridis]
MGGPPGILTKIVAFVCAGAQVLSGATFIYYYSKYITDKTPSVTLGCTPQPRWNGCSGSANLGWYLTFSLFAFGIMSFIFGIAEIGLLFFTKYFSAVSSPLLRGLVYVLKGLAVFGVAGDLGISAGVIEMVCGAFLVIFWILTVTVWK